MTQQNQRSKKILGIIAAISGSLLLTGAPALAQNNQNGPYNGNGQVGNPNDNPSPDFNNPGINHSPQNRLTPVNPGSGSQQYPGNSGDNSSSGSQQDQNSNSNSGYQQQNPSNSSSSGNYNTNNSNSLSSRGVLNPCPSIFYEPKYRDTVGIPAGCPATSP